MRFVHSTRQEAEHMIRVCQTMQINDIKSPAALSSKLFNDTGSLRDFVQNLLHHQNRKMMLCVDPTTNLRSILFSWSRWRVWRTHFQCIKEHIWHIRQPIWLFFIFIQCFTPPSKYFTKMHRHNIIGNWSQRHFFICWWKGRIAKMKKKLENCLPSAMSPIYT